MCGETDPGKFTKGRYTRCKKCRSVYRKKYVKEVAETRKNGRIRAIEYLGGKCICCGFDKGISAFDFHHVDPKDKDPNFRSSRHWSWERFKNEIDKCLLLCSNCHRLLHNSNQLQRF